MTLLSGDVVIAHATPVDVVFYVLEGKPGVTIGKETESFEPGTLVQSPAHPDHSLRNEGDKVARLLVIKAPKPQRPA
jgi:quercetin dioxygenase-like cupin family protein